VRHERNSPQLLRLRLGSIAQLAAECKCSSTDLAADLQPGAQVDLASRKIRSQ
jgi:hypothetical protein